MTVFIIDEKALEQLKTFAEAHPFTTAQLEEIIAKKRPVPGDTEGYYCLLPLGYKVVLTIEDHGKAWLRHMSMSISTFKRLPSPQVVEQVMPLLGFTKPLSDCILDIEKIEPGYDAINVAEIMEDKK